MLTACNSIADYEVTSGKLNITEDTSISKIAYKQLRFSKRQHEQAHREPERDPGGNQ